jgi:putative transposase
MPYLSVPRKARIDAPGALHHIIVRGIDRNPIFKGSEDYENFLVRLGRVLQETSTTCYAWALIPNHVHLLLRTGTTPISTVMRRLLTGYAQAFNRRYNRHGYLFQNRYKSFLCETDPYLLWERYPMCGRIRTLSSASSDRSSHRHGGYTGPLWKKASPWEKDLISPVED